jgi:hypothetical protein
MRVLTALAILGLLHVTPVVAQAASPIPAEKLPAPPRTPETGVDPGIQAHPGPSPDPHTAVPPKINPDPEMAIHPDSVPGSPNRRRSPDSNVDPNSRPPAAGSDKRSDAPMQR